MTIEAINIHTCDENWSPKFLDENYEKVRKLIELKNLYLYFNPEDSEMMIQKC